MKKIYKLVLLLLCFGFSLSAVAQQTVNGRIEGTVTDRDGEFLVGAVVSVKGTNNGTTTNSDGGFTLTAPLNSILVVDYLGYATQEIPVNSRTQINIVLDEETSIIDEVTVTALGITREKKALGYAMGTVNGDELEKAKEPNLINSLAGKIPGLIISQTASGPAGSTRVLIRGNTVLAGDNQPLYVVDGIPLDNTNFGSADQWGGFDLGDGISTINPDDVESMSVLKGPAASALYGSRASHGVILITTKKATKERKGLGIEFNSTTTFDTQLSKRDDMQTIYGMGSGGRHNLTAKDDRANAVNNWGPKIDPGMSLITFDGVTRPYKYVENNLESFFRTGITTTNTLILSKYSSDTGIRFSYTNLYNEDIVPNSGMQRNTFNMRANTKIAKKLSVDGKINYVREDVKNRPTLSGSSYNLGSTIMYLSNTFDQSWIKDYYKDEYGNYADWNGDVWTLNPYWVLNEMTNVSVKDKFSGMMTLDYAITDKINVRVNGGGDINFFSFEDYSPPTTPRRESGQFNRRRAFNYNYNVEALVSYKDKFGDFSLGANVGANIYHMNRRSEVVNAMDMQVRDVVTLASFASITNVESELRKQINSAFGMINLGYRDFLYLDVTGRVDKSSTLPKNNNTYFYSSVSGSFLFSEILCINKDIMSYGKLRASAAQVGSDTDPYSLNLAYGMLSNSFNGMILGDVANTSIPNNQLKPTRTNSYEVGIELRFLKNRVGLDFTYYSQNSRDQIMQVDVSHASGYDKKYVNAGEISNKGIEIVLNTRPLQIGDFSWDLNFNFSKNSNKVISLTDGVDKISLASSSYLNVSVDAMPGENYGVIMGKDFTYSPDGQMIINTDTGYPVFTETPVILGNAMWDWTGGLTTVFKYKTITLTAVFDIKVGADWTSQLLVQKKLSTFFVKFPELIYCHIL